MSDRLDELRHQRALVQEQLAWIDREIARETNTPIAATPAPAPLASPVVPAAPAADEAEAERILEGYRAPQGSIHANVKKGCFLYFFAAFAVVGLAVLALYFAFRR